MQLSRVLPLIAVAAHLSAQSPPVKVTHVLATLSLKPGITREQIQPTMPREVRETVALYLDGKIEQWYSRGDGKGVVFLVNCATVDEAKAILETLPLVNATFAVFEYMPLGPLNPLRVLMDAPAPK